jgi:hypothetical protein
MTAWSHLPNAVHIDRIIADAKANPGAWLEAGYSAWAVSRLAPGDLMGSAVWDATRDAMWLVGRDVMWDEVWDATRNAAGLAAWHTARLSVGSSTGLAAWDAACSAAGTLARSAARGAAEIAAYSAAGDAVLALIAWDNCVNLLNTDTEQVRVLARLGHQPSVLLLPAAIALNKVKQLEIV